MNKIAIYVEGGGDASQQRAELRNGFDRLLGAQKRAAQAKHLGWRLVAAGSRNNACAEFIAKVASADEQTLCILLVDSEEGLPPELPVKSGETAEERQIRRNHDARVRRDHLAQQDGWELKDISPEGIHLMVRCMETWIVADPDGMAVVYARDFHRDRLPQRINLEDEPKADLYHKLAEATKDTTKGAYSKANHSKIKHASKLLERIDADRVARRCPRFATFTAWLTETIANSQQPGRRWVG